MKTQKELNLKSEKKAEPSETNYQAINNSLNKTPITITQLPTDMLLLILSYLNIGQLTQIASVSKLFSLLATSDRLWKNLLIEIRGTREIPEQQSYKKIYADEKYATALKLQEKLKCSNPDLTLDIPKIANKKIKKFLKMLGIKPNQKTPLAIRLLHVCAEGSHNELINFLKNNKEQLVKVLKGNAIFAKHSLIHSLQNLQPKVFPTLAWFLSDNNLVGRSIAYLFEYDNPQKFAYILAKLAAILHDKLTIYYERSGKDIPLVHYVIIMDHKKTSWLLPLLVAYDMHCLTYKFDHKGETDTALAFALEFARKLFVDREYAFALLCQPFYPVLKFHGCSTLYPVISGIFFQFPKKALSFLTHMKKSDVIHYRDWENEGLNKGNTVLHYAVRLCKVNDDLETIIKTYRELINIINQEKKTLLHIAIDENKRELNYPLMDVVQILLKYGADINIQDKQSMSALDAARQYDLPEIIKLLEEKKKIREDKTDYQPTPKLR